MTTEPKNKREKIQIMEEIIALATSGIRKTEIMRKANLSHKQMCLYLEELISKRLISQDLSTNGAVYRTTEKGREFLLYYTRLIEFLGEGKQGLELGSSSPYITSRSSMR